MKFDYKGWSIVLLFILLGAGLVFGIYKISEYEDARPKLGDVIRATYAHRDSMLGAQVIYNKDTLTIIDWSINGSYQMDNGKSYNCILIDRQKRIK